MKKFTLPFFAAVCLTAVATPALADEVTVRVDYADLDLSNPHDVSSLKRRIVARTEAACRKGAGSALFSAKSFTDCRNDGVSKAFRQLEQRRTLAATQDSVERS